RLARRRLSRVDAGNLVLHSPWSRARTLAALADLSRPLLAGDPASPAAAGRNRRRAPSATDRARGPGGHRLAVAGNAPDEFVRLVGRRKLARHGGLRGAVERARRWLRLHYQVGTARLRVLRRLALGAIASRTLS